MPISEKILILTADYAAYRRCALAYVQFNFPSIAPSDLSVITIKKNNILAWNIVQCNVLVFLNNFNDLLAAFRRIKNTDFKVVFLSLANMPRFWMVSFLWASFFLLHREREIIIIDRWNRKASMKVRRAKLPRAFFAMYCEKLGQYLYRKFIYVGLKLRNCLADMLMRGISLWQWRHTLYASEDICVAYRTSAGLGDFIITVPVLENLRINFPQAKIVAIIPEEYQDISKCIPFVSEWIFFNKTKWFRNIFKIFPGIVKLQFKEVYLLGGEKSELPAFDKFIRGSRICNIVKFARMPARKTSPSVPKKPADTYTDFLGNCKIPVSAHLPNLAVHNNSRVKIKNILGSYGVRDNHLLVVLTPGTAPHKRWGAVKFAAIGDYLKRTYDAKIIIAEPLASYSAEVDDEVSGLMKEEHINLAGLLSVDLYAGLLEQAELLIVNDSGASEIAVGLRTNCIVIYGSTSPGLPGHSIASHASVRPDIECSPCNSASCLFDKRLCFDRITVDQIARKADNFLADRTKSHETFKS